MTFLVHLDRLLMDGRWFLFGWFLADVTRIVWRLFFPRRYVELR